MTHPMTAFTENPSARALEVAHRHSEGLGQIVDAEVEVEEGEAVGIMMIEGETGRMVTMIIGTCGMVDMRMDAEDHQTGQLVNGENTQLLLIAQDETLKHAVKTRIVMQNEMDHLRRGNMVMEGMYTLGQRFDVESN
jgi:hypothetical protein